MRLLEVRDPNDPMVGRVAQLLLDVFGDPNTVLAEDRMREFLAHSGRERTFTILALLDADGQASAAGACVFSYVPRSNCGFSEYLVVRRGERGRGLGRRLVDARTARLDAAAQAAGARACNGVFIEAENPERTPADVLRAERDTAGDPHERLRIFAHLGFSRVDLPYTQPSLGPGKTAVDYLDLLFAPCVAGLHEVPSAWVVETVGAIWRAWTADPSAAPHVSSEHVPLVPLVSLQAS